MYLNLCVVSDLIINTLKNCFLIEETTIESMKKSGDLVSIYLTTKEDKNRKFRIDVKFNCKTHEVEFEWLSLTIYDMCDNNMPNITTRYSASALIQFEDTMRFVLKGCWFYAEEFKEVLE